MTYQTFDEAFEAVADGKVTAEQIAQELLAERPSLDLRHDYSAETMKQGQGLEAVLPIWRAGWKAPAAPVEQDLRSFYAGTDHKE